MTAVTAPLPAARAGRRAAAGARVAAWWFDPVPARRVGMVRALVYAFVVFDVLMLVNDVVPHGYGPADLYRPILVPRLLHLPAPNPFYVHALRAVLVGAAVVAATGRLPRAAGWVVAVAYLDWVFLGFSYGKVDHDHLALVVALFVLPLAGAGRGDGASEAAAWSLRCVQVAVIATYFLSAYAKVRHGGWGWPNSATFAWAVHRRGTALATPLLDHPGVLVAAQWGLLLMEAVTPVVLFLRRRALWLALGALAAFHLTTYAMIEIHFLPTVVCFAAFLPLERLRVRRRA
jgi:hypothetical protein